MKVSLGLGLRELSLSFRHAYHLKTKLSIGVWVVEGRAVTCLFNDHDFAVACDTSANTARYGLVIISGPSPSIYKHPPVVALGIVPNRFRTVRLGVVGGRDHLVGVVGNTFALRARHPIIIKGVSI